MTTPLLLTSPPVAIATRDDIDLALLERDFEFLPHLRYGSLEETKIEFEALSSQSFLPADFEVALFRQMHLALYRAEAIRGEITTAPSFRRSELDELLRLAARADRIRNSLVVVFSKLALSIAAQFASATNPLDELMSESHEAVIRAVGKFDPDRGFRFSTYLTHAVRRQLLRYLQRRQRDRQRTFSTPDETAIEATNRWTLAYEQRIRRNMHDVELLLTELSSRDRYVIRSRFGWGREFEPRTLQEIAAELGVTRERVRQLEQRALRKLNALATKENLELA